MTQQPEYRSPMTPQQGDPVSGIIPYKNVPALVGYYLGVFSIIPCIGVFLGIAAIILGIKGLKVAAERPEAKGKGHAIVAIVCGAVFGAGWLILDILFIVGMVFAR